MKHTEEQFKTIGNYLTYLDLGYAISADWEKKVEFTVEELTNFTTRDEYLAWAAEWKAQYAALSKEIRQLKQSRKLSSPTYNPLARDLAYRKGWHATIMLYIRAQSKMKASRLRNQRRQDETVGKA